MKVALASVYTKNSDIDYNFKCIKNIYGEALRKSVELLIFPHLAVNGLQIDSKNLEEDRYFGLLDDLISLTHGKKCAMLVGGIYIKDGEFKREIYDSVLFMEKDKLERIISRKTIDKNNVLADNRVFDRGIFLDAFEYGKKRFNVLLSDDIFSNFNIILSSEQKPDYIICLDSSIYENDFKIKHLTKMAKCANCPVFYMNSANCFTDDLHFNGDIILINEDFKTVLNTFYTNDRLVIFDIDNEDGTEILLKEEVNDKIVWVKKNKDASLRQNINILRKNCEWKKMTVNCEQYDIPELKKIKKEIKNCKLIKFSDNTADYTGLNGIKMINLFDFYNVDFFNSLGEGEKNILKEITISL
jgi:predicted amidohydrolase